MDCDDLSPRDAIRGHRKRPQRNHRHDHPAELHPVRPTLIDHECRSDRERQRKDRVFELDSVEEYLKTAERGQLILRTPPRLASMLNLCLTNSDALVLELESIGSPTRTVKSWKFCDIAGIFEHICSIMGSVKCNLTVQVWSFGIDDAFAIHGCRMSTGANRIGSSLAIGESGSSLSSTVW